MKFLLLTCQGITEYILLKRIERSNYLYSPPLGLLYIGKSLEEEGHKVEVLHPEIEDKFIEKIGRKIKSLDAIGISLTSISYKDGENLVRNLKEIDSSIPIIIGGPHCTYHPKTSLKHIPSADISVEGEGDFSIKDIAKAIQGKIDFSCISGIYYKEKNRIKKGQPLKIIKDLDILPFPARYLVDKYDYGKVSNKYFFKPKLTSMISSRGCPFNCRFCARKTLTFGTYRERSAENVVREIEEINKKYNSVFFVDDNFLANTKRAHKIFDIMLEIDIDIGLYIFGARVDSADKALFKKMKKGNVKYIEFGIESGNQDVLNFYNKNVTIGQIRKAINLCRQMNFITAGNFIIGAPIETKQHIKKTIKFACSLPLDIAVFYPLGYIFGSDLWDEAVDNGLVIGDDEFLFSADSRRGLGNFKSEELEEYCINASKKFYLRASFIGREIFRSILRKDFRFLEIGLRNL